MKKDNIDFSGVAKEIGGGTRHIPAGDYLAKITGVEKKWKDNDKTNAPYYNWKFQVTNGNHKGVTLYFITSLKPESLWNLRNLIHAVTKKNVAGKSVSFDPESIVGKIIAVTVDDDEYKNKTVSRVVEVRHKDDLEDNDGDDDEEEEEEEEEDEDLEDVDVEDI